MLYLASCTLSRRIPPTSYPGCETSPVPCNKLFCRRIHLEVQNFRTGSPNCGHYDITMTVFSANICQLTTSVSPSSVFVSWPGNYKIMQSSPLYGTGAAYGGWSRCGVYGGRSGWSSAAGANFHGWNGPTWWGCNVTSDTSDLFANARPQGAR